MNKLVINFRNLVKKNFFRFGKRKLGFDKYLEEKERNKIDY